MRIKLILVLILAAFMCVSCVTRSPEFTLVKNASPLATIIVPQNATTNELHAASELSAYMEKISGAKLSITNESPSVSRYPIYVGNTRAFAREQIAIPRAELSGEGFVIAAGGRGLFLAGSNDQCTLFAAYDFLETLGCRFYFPGEQGEVIPRRETIRIPALNIAEKPAMIAREFWLLGYKVRPVYENEKLIGFTAPVVPSIANAQLQSQLVDWATKNKMGGARLYAAHNWTRIVLPTKIFFQSHPEYYSLVKGRRNDYQLCSSHPDVIRYYIEAANLFFDQHPGYLTFSLTPNDGPLTCECDNCRALDDPARAGDHGRRLAIFVNTVARDVRKKHPDKFLAYLATYTDDLRSPPADVEMEKNVMPWVVNEPRYVKEWAAKGVPPSFYIWVYDPITSGFPFNDNLHGIPEIVRAAHSGGAISLCEEADHSPLNYPTLYLSMKLGWDGKLDLDSARRAFFSEFFGPAAREMEGFWKGTGEVKDVPDLDRWGQPLAAARKRVGEEQPYAARIEQVQNIFDITRLYFQLANLAQVALESGLQKDREKFRDAYNALIGLLSSDTGRLLPNQGKLLAKLNYTFGVLAGAKPKYSHLQNTEDFLWGDFDYKVDGYMRAMEAVSPKNILVRSSQLGLAANSEGGIEWEFRAPDGATFRRAKAALMAILPSNDNAEVAFEISTDGGKSWRTAHKSARPESPIDFTPFMAGAKAFLLRVSAANKTDTPWYFLEDLRIELSTN
ncbi:MAG: DUF4838 domain-containing protein [Verrucomicrobia bacterium]|nr:DUF4838 domain-containing protein [Verrucomicrobiota bacterium]